MKSIQLFIILIIISINSCTNKDDVARYTLYTINSDKKCLAGAKVTLYTSTQKDLNTIDSTFTTNAEGCIDFTYKYECFLTVHATYSLDSISLFNETEIHIEPNKHTIDTLILW